jgi:aryl-alcohol dehydrogenase-like predicted oxidoreductase
MSARWLTDRNLTIAAEVERVAEEARHTPSQVALNWLRQQPTKKPLIPILGARTEEQILDNLGCLDFELTQEQVDALSEVSKVDLGFPREMFGRGGFTLMWGNKFVPPT